MKITNISVRVINDSKNPKLKGFASIVFNDCFVVRDISIIHKFTDSDGNKNMFAAMPSKRLSDGSYIDLAFPKDQKTRDWIEGAILDEYEALVADNTEGL